MVSVKLAFLALAIAPFAAGTLLRQDPDPEMEAEYLKGPTTDSVSKLVAAVKAGSIKLSFEPKQGYLKAVLKVLGISPTSQVLVFSKTSLQTSYISADTPRAIYFNDQTYIAWIPGAPNIEIASVDPKLGPIFYTLPNESGPSPKLIR